MTVVILLVTFLGAQPTSFGRFILGALALYCLWH